MAYRVWWHEEFKDCKTDEERDELAWTVPDRHGILNPDARTPCDNVDDAAEQYADYFHSHRDGYENQWPVEFVVHDGEKFYLVSVDRDFDPVFSSNGKSELAVQR